MLNDFLAALSAFVREYRRRRWLRQRVKQTTLPF
jgi:hypothetical protein